jgi:hypothetical protein
MVFTIHQRNVRRVARDDRSEDPMSDVHALPALPAARQAPAAIDADEELAVTRGLVNAALLSVPLWALIGLAIAALV